MSDAAVLVHTARYKVTSFCFYLMDRSY